MGWFDKQIREIKESDQEAFEDSIFRMATVILGSRDSGTAEDDRILTKAAVDEIVKYYHFKPVEVPAQVKDADEALAILSENGISPYILGKITKGTHKVILHE